jgi:hypothetical protein
VRQWWRCRRCCLWWLFVLVAVVMEVVVAWLGQLRWDDREQAESHVGCDVDNGHKNNPFQQN